MKDTSVATANWQADPVEKLEADLTHQEKPHGAILVLPIL
jgi:hypothetical protein